jgi:hypothetical protein
LRKKGKSRPFWERRVGRGYFGKVEGRKVKGCFEKGGEVKAILGKEGKVEAISGKSREGQGVF